ncbi:MAG: hypothetical protein MJY70_05025 [Bacteroidales bacterium]|nr:hypothetical protein [Bacteroidales bacterium]
MQTGAGIVGSYDTFSNCDYVAGIRSSTAPEVKHIYPVLIQCKRIHTLSSVRILAYGIGKVPVRGGYDE